MSKMKATPRMRVIFLLVAFTAVVISAAMLYNLVGRSLVEQPSHKWMLILFGPVLALPTHMSILLFLPLCVPLVALLCIGALYSQTRTAVAVGFLTTWLVMGWYLKGLF
jgi:chromate transport protein ChrA